MKPGMEAEARERDKNAVIEMRQKYALQYGGMWLTANNWAIELLRTSDLQPDKYKKLGTFIALRLCQWGELLTAAPDPPSTPGPLEPELAAIAERVGKATKGPWEAQEMLHCGEPGTGYTQAIRVGDYWEDDFTGMSWEDGQFIAHARQDIPRLLEIIAQLTLAQPSTPGPLAKHIEVSKELTTAKRRLDQDRILFAELYQVAGVLFQGQLVPKLMLDKLSAGQRGLPFPKGSLLPFTLEFATQPLPPGTPKPKCPKGRNWLAVEAERKRCAEIARSMAQPCQNVHWQVADDIAAAILEVPPEPAGRNIRRDRTDEWEKRQESVSPSHEGPGDEK